MAKTESTRLDIGATRHYSTSPINLSSGSSRQVINTIAGGSGNTQYNATNQYFNSAHVPNQDHLDEDFRKTLFCTNPAVDRNDLIDSTDGRVANTCKWVCTIDKYKALREGTERLLWIWGEPRKGKTVMSIFISQELELEKRAKTKYFFCKAKRKERNAATAVLRGLLWQLTAICPELTRALRERCGTVDNNFLSSRETLWIKLTELIALVRSGRLYCVIDRLDECDHNSRQWLARKFLSLQNDGCTSNFSTIIASRYLVELRNTYQVDLGSSYSERIKADVKTFVEEKTAELFKRFTFNAMQREKIRDKLSKGAKGTFLWVGFAMVDLLKQENITQVMRALEKLPAGLFPLYDRMLRDVEPDQSRISLCVLVSVAMAYRALTLEEVALVVHCLWPKSDSPITEEDLQATIEGCGPLFRFEWQTLVLAHESLRDYVRENVFPNAFHLKPQETHLRFAWACIDALDPGKQGKPLAEYAAEFWPHHARKSDTLAAELISHPSQFFETKSDLRIDWWIAGSWYTASSRVLWHYNPESQGDIPRLHMACYLGIKPWAEDILEKRKSRFLPNSLISRHRIASRDRAGRTALHWAILGGQLSIVKMLLERQADVDIRDERGRTALQYAANESLETIAKLLLDYNASIDTGSRDGSALYLAVLRSDEAMVKLLLDHKANPDTRHRHVTVLHLAVAKGLEAIVKLLLDYGANVNTRIPTDHETETRRLDDQRADPVGLIKQKASEFAATASAISRDTLIMLMHGLTADDVTRRHVGIEADLDAKVNIGAKGNVETAVYQAFNCPESGTALHCAAYNGHEAIAKLLLDYKISVDIQTSFGETALHLAAWRCDVAMIKLLIDHKADANARNTNGRTALHFAARDQKTVELLLEHGADASAKDNSDETILHYAAGWKAEAVVKLLVERGADPLATDALGRTMLHHAVDESYARMSYSQLISTTEIILGHQVNINTEDREGKTVLFKALQRYQRTGQLSKDEDVGKTKERNQWRGFMVVLLGHGAHFDPESVEGSEVQQAIEQPS